jgi:hypothetical protein
MASPGATFVSELAKQTDNQVTDLQAKLKDQQQIQRFLVSLAERLRDERHSEALKVLATSKKQLELLGKKYPESATQIEALAAELRALAEATVDDLPRTFPAEIQTAGLTLDPSSRHPKYTLLDEFIEVRFNKAKLESTVLPRDGRKIVLGIEPKTVVARLASEVDRLTGRPFEPRTFLSMLSNAYRAVSAEVGAGSGENIPLKQLVAELAKDKDFRADEFNVDLSRFVRDKESSGKVSLDNARDAKNGVLLWELDERGYYGYIRMEG